MKKSFLLFIHIFILMFKLSAQKYQSSEILFGVAYYDEYMPFDRLEKDVSMMKAAGINIVRIAESTWGTVETQEGVFDYSHIDRVLNAMHKAGIKVIVGTPTYAIPTWLAKKHPDILVITPNGQAKYGTRQNMDITNIHFKEAAERVIRNLMEHIKDHPAIAGYQVDNETKSYSTSGPDVQKLFVEYCKQKFKNLDAVNDAFGLNYWSNRINSWDDFPSTIGSINASLSAEFSKFQRKLVTDYLAWQVAIVNEYKRPGQFVTQNFDLDWRGYSFGIQSEVDHFAAAAALDVAGIDIYHPSQDLLTGTEVSLGGDIARSMKAGRNYFVMETQAQGFPEWIPYPGQLRLLAYSHLASGANMVSYWHWHSIHNSAETYWKGLLSHDFEPNATYNEAKIIGEEFRRFSKHLVNIKITNKAAILFSNEALTAFNSYGFGLKYNDVLRPYYDALYRMNVGVDFIDPTSINIDKYKLIIVPALYAAPDSLLQKLNEYVKNGGHIVYTFRSGFSNENVKVRTSTQPGIINQACGISYNQFTIPKNVGLKGQQFDVNKDDNVAKSWIELISTTTAKTLAYYDHPVWGKYSALTQNNYGKGLATYVGFMPTPAMIREILKDVLYKAKIEISEQITFPIIKKTGINQNGKLIQYFLNYSDKSMSVNYVGRESVELFSNSSIKDKDSFSIKPWSVNIYLEK